MALRDQPYLPLYIKDYITDEKLAQCSAATQGIYVRIMCAMHKSANYGKLELAEKFKQNESKELGFAKLLLKLLPFSEQEILDALKELIAEGVCYFEDNFLCQKRMVKDGELSLKRSESGSAGGKRKGERKKNAQAKPKQNTENEIENEIENNSVLSKNAGGEKKPKPLFEKVWELPGNDMSQTAKDTWATLCKTPKWKKKNESALTASLKKLLAFDEMFAIVLMENAIAGGYQGVVFDSTAEAYEKWKRNNSPAKREMIF